MKHLSIVTILLCAPLALAQPQERPGRGAGGGRMIEQWRQAMDSLDLTAEQKGKIDEILSAAPEKFRKVMDETADLDRAERGQRMRELMTEIRGEIDQQLTAEQKEKLDAKVEELREQARERFQGQGQGQGRGFNPAGRLEEAVASLNLTAEQKEQADRVVAELRNKSEEIRAAAANDPQAAREQAREAFTSAREELSKILTDEQREKLREALAPPGGPGEGRGRGPDGAPPATRPSSDAGNHQPTANAVGLFVSGAVILTEGDDAPPFELMDLNGRKHSLATLKQRPTVIVFGSYSSPVFREHAKALNQLRRDFGARINFCIIYTREAYAAGEWEIERNRDDGVTISPHADAAARLAEAKKATKLLDLDGPILLDSMDDATLKSYGGHRGATILVGRDGKVLAFQKWFEPHALRRSLSELR